MLPKYENGDIIVVYREQRHPISSFYGEEAAVRLKTGERYLKTIERGKSATHGQSHELQRQADRRGQAGMDRGDLRHPAEGPDRAAAGQGRGPFAQGSQGTWRRITQAHKAAAGTSLSTDSRLGGAMTDDQSCHFLIFRIIFLTKF